MQSNEPSEPEASLSLSMLAAADLQDHLMTATSDLDRLQTLLAHACEALYAGFHGASELVGRLGEGHVPQTEKDRALEHLGSAVTALQFQDIASQLIAHTHRRLRNCADKIARDTFAGDEDGEALVEEAPLRPNPVTQSEMDAGSVELF
jgi:hypothetical protein